MEHDTDDLRALLKENLRLAKDTNRMLHAMRRAAIFAFVGRIIFWIIILGVPAYLYVTYLAPMLPHILPQGATSSSTILNLLGIPSPQELQQVSGTLSNLSHATQSVQSILPTGQ